MTVLEIAIARERGVYCAGKVQRKMNLGKSRVSLGMPSRSAPDLETNSAAEQLLGSKSLWQPIGKVVCIVLGSPGPLIAKGFLGMSLDATLLGVAESAKLSSITRKEPRVIRAKMLSQMLREHARNAADNWIHRAV
jgi:hypothetical protein